MNEKATFELLPKMVYELKEQMDYITDIIKSLKPEKDQNKLLTVHEAANFLNLSVPTIYSKANKNELPFMKKGKRLYFFTNELLNYIKSGKISSIEEINDRANNYMNIKTKN